MYNESGKKCQLDGDEVSDITSNTYDSQFLAWLHKLIESPPDDNEEFTQLKKDLLHAFRMIPISVDHGLRGAFTKALRDHLMRWDPDI